MPRYKLTIEYDGTPFAGWQIQANGQSVQGRLRDAIYQFSREDVTPRGAGRTDAGVHANGQVAHLDLSRDWDAITVMRAINYYLKPDPISIIACENCEPTFDARFSAVKRHYLYRIITRAGPLALDRNRAWHVRHALDAEAMDIAAQVLVGHHDFTTFRASQCQAKSPFKTLDRLSVTRSDTDIQIVASAQSFLHHQVRSITGSLKLVGEGKWSVDDLASALAARNRAACGALAPPQGLYLTRVDYA